MNSSKNSTDFVITRITALKGRNVSSLEWYELDVLKKHWLRKVEHAWKYLDEETKAHYFAIRRKLAKEYQKN